MSEPAKKPVDMETIISLTKRRGFIFPSSEIYGGFSGVYDFGPIGSLLENNIKALWWKEMVQKHSNIVGLDSAIFMSPKVWEASGHVKGFADPMVQCKTCNTRSRADHLLEDVGANADEKMTEEQIVKIFDENRAKIKCPKCGSQNFGQPKFFNLLVKSNLGDFTSNNEDPSYLRGETCQGIYVNFKNVIQNTNVKIPFGIAQIGKSFRNEISARQFIFRLRELQQMEMQYFVYPDEDMKEYDIWKEKRMKFLTEIMGIKSENLQWQKHKNLVFYAKEAYDIEYKFPFGFKELEGVHARGNYDLTAHSKGSGEDLSYFDQTKNEKFVPHIVETAAGVERLFLALICDAYHEEEVDGETRVVLKFKNEVAPIKIAVLPLMKKEGLVEKAEEVFKSLSDKFMCQYDETASIGKRYRRQDEIGTPYCVTIDFDSLERGTVTVRERDSMKQEIVKIDDLKSYFGERFS